LARFIRDADGVVNATPMGMAAHPGSAVPSDLLRSDLWIADIVYFPLETQFLHAARLAGCRTLDGGGMAVFQAARAFEIFTGRKADCERMRRQFATLTQP
jgi:shikimate dehydrogenase